MAMESTALAFTQPDKADDGDRDDARKKYSTDPCDSERLSHRTVELGRDVESLRDSEKRLRLAVDAGGVGIFDYNPVTGDFICNRQARTLLGIEPDIPLNLDLFRKAIHLDDEPAFADALASVLDPDVENSHLHIKLRMRPLDDSPEKWICAVGQSSFEGEGAECRAVRLIGAITDITLWRQSQQVRDYEEALQHSQAEIKELTDRLRQETEYLKLEISEIKEHGDIIGKSGPLLKVLRQAEKVAFTDTSVVLTGETGTGKELIARQIHKLSRRGNRAMVCINCASLPAYLVESELFGRERGAYTGALTSQAGRFEVADQSTLFLDEVTELPYELQAKLLRVLQEGEFERLGSTRTVRVDVRVIAASNKDLAKAVAEGKFREDLYYRLNVYPIRVPPLRERPEDIPLFVRIFTAEFAERMGKTIAGISEPTMQALQSYSWPGNVRELRNVIERAVIVNEGDVLKVNPSSITLPGPTRILTLEQVEAAHVQSILKRVAWRIKGRGGAADLLGLEPSTLYSKIKKLGIPIRGAKDDI